MARTANSANPAAAPGAYVPDRQHHWVDRLPPRLRAYAILARLDRPIGTWLLLLPCWWGLALAPGLPSLWLGLACAVGAVVMRGAGCTINDLIDRDFDARVERTRQRPLASGQIGAVEAAAFILAQCAVGLLVLTQFSWPAILIAFCSIPLVVAYPFMKRITWWPQAFLGLTFNWGIWVGYAAATDTLSWACVPLYAAGILWTLGYDTIYAHQDKVDDELIGVRSTARLLGRETPRWLWGFYAAMLAMLALAGLMAGKGLLFWLLLPVVAWSLVDQIRSLDMEDPANCIAQFRKNRLTGLLVTAALALGSIAF